MAVSAVCRTVSAPDAECGRKRVFGSMGCFFFGNRNTGSDGIESGEANRPDECEFVDADWFLRLYSSSVVKPHFEPNLLPFGANGANSMNR